MLHKAGLPEYACDNWDDGTFRAVTRQYRPRLLLNRIAHPARLHCPVELSLFGHLVEFLSGELVVRVSLDGVEFEDDFPSLIDSAFHEEVSRAFGQNEANENHEEGPDQCNSEWTTPLCRRVLDIVKCQTHLETVRKGPDNEGRVLQRHRLSRQGHTHIGC